MPIATPPFYAAPAIAGVTYTMGGIAIDGDARVLRRDGGSIEGLFAAGSATGGHEGGPRVGYTGGLSKALTFGWCAARAIAREAPPQSWSRACPRARRRAPLRARYVSLPSRFAEYAPASCRNIRQRAVRRAR